MRGPVMAILAILAALAALLPLRPAGAADRLTIILDWFVNANHEALLSAQYSGAYARHGLDVRFIVPSDPGSPPRLLPHTRPICASATSRNCRCSTRAVSAWSGSARWRTRRSTH